MNKLPTLNEEIYNNDVFQILLEYEISRCQRYPAPLSLLQIEMTPHSPSTEALGAASQVFSRALNSHLRSVDIPSKKTEKFFTILLPNSDIYGAQVVCERLLAVFESKFETPDGSSIVFSLYIGSASHSGGPTVSSEVLLRKAGEALKQARLKGANSYVVS